MTILDNFFDKIKNGAWHSLTELSKTLNIPIDQLVEISKSLSEQELVKYEEKAKWVKINTDWKPLLSEEETEPEEAKEAEHKPTVGTVIIPSKKSLTIQNIQISNTTDKDLELLLRICNRFLELAISKIIR